MKQDKYNPAIYWHGGKMYFTGGAMTDFMKNNKSEIGLVGGAVGQAVESLSPKTSMAGNIGGSALKYGSIGASLGPLGAVGGIALGAGLGFVNAKQAQEEQAMAREAESRDAYAAGTSGISSDAHVYAYGGNFAQGGITPRLTEFNEGGSHEQNADGGVSQGVNSQNGQPNLVEQGETKFKDYIFSDRLTLPNAKEYNLGGHLSGKTFAAISKKLSKSIEERPNDPIAKLGQDKVLERLKMANDDAIEMKKFSDENEQFKCGGKMKLAMKSNKFEYGGYIFNDI